MDSLTREKIKITDTNIRKDANGKALRIPSDVQRYGIKAVFAAVPADQFATINRLFRLW